MTIIMKNFYQYDSNGRTRPLLTHKLSDHRREKRFATDMDPNRVIAHFDVDCFYAQAEILRQPHLRERPVGITQKFLVVTCNYVARQFGVPKMVPVEEARRRCPDLVLINGEDLTPYRAASKEIMKVLGRFGTLERLGLDECALDITSETQKRAAAGTLPNNFSGLIIGSDPACEIVRDRKEEASIVPQACSHRVCSSSSVSERESKEINIYANIRTSDVVDDKLKSNFFEDRNLLMVGTYLVAEIRAAVEQETGFQCSCGISYNKMLAKMACSINKPNKQTCLLKSAVPNFLCSLPVRKLPGVGHRTESMLKEIGIQTITDLQGCNLQQLMHMFGEKVAHFLFNASRGVDVMPVRDKGPPKSLSVEDSFLPCTSLKGIEVILSSLALDLVARLDEDKLETGRTPQVFSVKWRQKGSQNFTSTSSQTPSELLSTKCPLERRKEILVQTGMSLLSRSLRGHPFSLVVLNIGATNFTDSGTGSLSASQDIRTLLKKSTKLQERDTVVSKQEVMLCKQGAETYNSQIGHDCPSVLDWKSHNRSGQPFSSGDTQGNSTSYHKETSKEQREKNKIPELNLDETPWQHRDDLCIIPTFPSSNAAQNFSSEAHLLSPSNCGESGLSLVNKDLTEESCRGHIVSFWHEQRKQCVSQQVTLVSENEYQERGEYRMAGSVNVETQPKISSGFMEHNMGNKCSMDTESEDSQTTIRCDSPQIGDLGMVKYDVKEFFSCEKCGQNMDCNEQTRQEHEDYHYALRLQSEESNQATTLLNNCRNQRNHMSRQPPSKRHKKHDNATLDLYFSRLK